MHTPQCDLQLQGITTWPAIVPRCSSAAESMCRNGARRQVASALAGAAGRRRGMAAHAMINEVLVAFDPFNKLLKLKNAQEYGKLFYNSCKGIRKMGGERAEQC